MADNRADSQQQSRAPAAGRHRKPPVVLSVAVCVFAVGAFLPTRALWIQLPGALADQSTGLHLHLLAVCLLSNVAGVLYLVVSLCCRRRGSSSSYSSDCDAAPIYVAVTCGLASLALLAVGRGGAVLSGSSVVADIVRLLPAWSSTTALLTAAALGAVAASLSALTYLPFAGRLDAVCSAGGNCISAVLIGDALSSLIPHLLVLIQGVYPEGRRYRRHCGS